MSFMTVRIGLKIWKALDRLGRLDTLDRISGDIDKSNR
ncbi:hypothetical protein CULC0102_2285 [Corynebacterium ulcerans 0102]|nr:hypothetical protein CULC0102_2285 [Corynebacterium ulcerans 0102]